MFSKYVDSIYTGTCMKKRIVKTVLCLCRSPKETSSEKMSAAGEPGYSGAGDPPAR